MIPASLLTEPREDQRHTFTLESCKPGYSPSEYIFYIAGFSGMSLLVAIQPLLHADLSLHDDLTRQCIITFFLLTSIPPLLYAYL